MTRLASALFAIATIALGAASRVVHLGIPLWDKSLGDVLYATLVFWLLLFARPRTRPPLAFAIALAICVVIECFQATGIPARSPRIVRIVLGTQFAWHDMACYVVGALVPALLVRRFAR